MMLLIGLDSKLIIKPDMEFPRHPDILTIEEFQPIRLSDAFVDENSPVPTRMKAMSHKYRWTMAYGEWSIWTEI